MKFLDVVLISASVLMVGGKATGLLNVSWLAAIAPVAIPFALGGLIALSMRKK